MKKGLCFLLCLVLAVGLMACRKEPAVTPSSVVPESSTVSSESSEPVASEPQETPEDKTLTKQGCPPLPADLQTLYQGAAAVYEKFCLCNFACDPSKTMTFNGMDYHPVTEAAYASYEDLRQELERYFTPELIAEQLLNDTSCVQQGPEGKAYVLDASGAASSLYAGHVFTVEQKTDTQITLVATVYAAKIFAAEEPFYKTPANPSEYDVTVHRLTLTMTDAGWRFSQFAFLRG